MPNQDPPDDLIGIDEVCAILGVDEPISHSTLYRWIKAGRVSKAYKVRLSRDQWSRGMIEADRDRILKGE